MFQQCLPPMATVCHGSTQETPLENACDFAKASIKFASSSARQDDCITARRSARLGDLHHALTFTWMPKGNFKVLGGADIVFLRAGDVSMIHDSFISIASLGSLITLVQVASTNLPSQGHTRTLQSALALAWEKKTANSFQEDQWNIEMEQGCLRSSCYQWVTPPSGT